MTSYKLLVGDMFDMIDEVDPFSVKCACIDPPYMIGTQSVDRANKIDPWADLMNAARFYRDVLEVIRPKLTVDGSLWVFMNWRGLASLYRASCDAKWLPASCMVWNKDWPGTGAPLRASHELCLLYTMDKFAGADKATKDVQTCKPVPTAHRVHQAKKPVQLLKRILEFSTREGDLVLDCFCGSGSTGVAALELGREFVGIESNVGIAECASDRLMAAANQGSLFGFGGEAMRVMAAELAKIGKTIEDVLIEYTDEPLFTEGKRVYRAREKGDDYGKRYGEQSRALHLRKCGVHRSDTFRARR